MGVPIFHLRCTIITNLRSITTLTRVQVTTQGGLNLFYCILFEPLPLHFAIVDLKGYIVLYLQKLKKKAIKRKINDGDKNSQILNRRQTVKKLSK